MDNLDKNFAQSPESQSFFGTHKLAISILGLMMLTLIVVAVLYQTEGRRALALTGLEVAERAALFLDNARQDDGAYLMSAVCNAEACSFNEGTAYHVGQIVMAFHDLYEATGNNEYKIKADRDLNAIMKRCETDLLFCEWNFFPLYKYYKVTGESKYREAMEKVGPKFFERMTLRQFMDLNAGIKLWMLYDVTGDERYKTSLLGPVTRILDGGLNEDAANTVAYEYNGNTIRHNDFKNITFDYLPAYRASGDVKYLQKAVEILDKAVLENNFVTLRSENKNQVRIHALDALLQVSNISEVDEQRRNKYKNTAVAMAADLLNHNVDWTERPLFTGDNALVFGEGGGGVKQTFTDGWFVRLMAGPLKNEKFRITLE